MSAAEIRMQRIRKLADLLFIQDQLGPDPETQRLIDHIVGLLKQP